MTALWSDRRGGVAVYFAVAVTALMALGGGAATMARLNAAGTRLQDLADGAAVAAAVQAQDSRVREPEIRDAAERYGREATASRSEQWTPAAMTVTVTRRAPAEVTVALQQEVHTVLARFVGRDSLTLRKHATAVSGPQRRTCLHVLEPSAPSALHLQGNPDIQAPSCMVQVNSTAAGALHAWGSPSAAVEGTLIAGPATPIRARNWSPGPKFGQEPRPDPLAERVTWPLPTADCIRQAPNASVLSPGAYCDGLKLGRGVRLEPGVYVIQTGGVEVAHRGNQAAGVTLVLLDPAGEFDIKGGGSLSLSAPTAGEWAGIALAAKPGPALTNSRIGGDLQLGGTLYLPGHKLQLQGSPEIGGPGADRALIVRQLVMQGAPRLNLAGGWPTGVYGAVRLSR